MRHSAGVARFEPIIYMLVVGYEKSGNFGDGVQTIAAMQWVSNVEGFLYRERSREQTGDLLINGWWLHDSQPFPLKAHFIGVHCNTTIFHKSKPFEAIGPFGARDHFSYYCANAFKMEAKLVGCWTSTFPRYEGPRSGRIGIDYTVQNGENLSSYFDSKIIDWKGHLLEALRRLRLLRTAEHVSTQRLHVALPCQAFGTPCYFWPPDHYPERFSTLSIDFDIVGWTRQFMDLRREPRTLDEIEQLIAALL